MRLDKPVIAAVDGAAYGAGFSLALAADFIIASTRARFVMSFIRVGVVPDCAAFYTLPCIVGAAPVLNLILRARQNGLVADVRGQSIHDSAPFYDTYVCANGHDITLGALEPQLYALLLDTLGLADGPKTRTYAGPQWNKTAWPARRSRLAAVFLARHARTGKHCWSPLMSALAPCSVPWKPLLRPGMTRQGLLGL